MLGCILLISFSLALLRFRPTLHLTIQWSLHLRLFLAIASFTLSGYPVGARLINFFFIIRLLQDYFSPPFFWNNLFVILNIFHYENSTSWSPLLFLAPIPKWPHAAFPLCFILTLALKSTITMKKVSFLILLLHWTHPYRLFHLFIVRSRCWCINLKYFQFAPFDQLDNDCMIDCW